MKRGILFGLIIIGIYYLITDPDFFQKSIVKDHEQKEMLIEKGKTSEKGISRSLNLDIMNWIGKSSVELKEAFGEPLREDLSPYGYTWYVYLDEYTKYLLFGIENDEIVTLFVTGSDLDLGDLNIGQSYEDVRGVIGFKDEVHFRKGTSSYTFHLDEDETLSRPLVKLDQNLFIQFYFDTITEQLSAIRLITGDTLLLQQSYELVYRGNLPNEQELDQNMWETIEQSQELQIFELTNVIRSLYNKSSLSWEEEVSNVAFAHSKDMADNDYFSHDSLSGEGLSDRLAHQNITYRLAGENIAANYPDALATVVGWLNSPGHRESLLNNEFTHLGVGVYRLYYTQNFLRK